MTGFQTLPLPHNAWRQEDDIARQQRRRALRRHDLSRDPTEASNRLASEETPDFVTQPNTLRT